MVEYEIVNKDGYENKRFKITNMAIDESFEFDLVKKVTSGRSQYGMWFLYEGRDKEGNQFSMLIDDNKKSNVFDKKLFEVLDTLIGKRVTLTRKVGTTKSGKTFNYWYVGTGQADQPTSSSIQLETPKKEVKLRNTTTGESEATILNAIKAGGKWNDGVVFIGTLVKYGCDESRAKELWNNRNSIDL